MIQVELKHQKIKLKNRYLTFVLLLAVLLFSLISLTSNSVFAQVTSGSPDAQRQFDIDDKINLEPITIPVFGDLSLGISAHATLFSWLSFSANVVVIALVVFWIFLVLRAGFEAIKSEGDAEKISEAAKKVKSALIGVGTTLIFPAILSIIGAIMGLGPLWTWPAAFRDCPNQKDSEEGSQFYFQEVLKKADTGIPNPSSAAEQSCFN
jgi:hypothetical protein